jgi:CCCH-type zinc finger
MLAAVGQAAGSFIARGKRKNSTVVCQTSAALTSYTDVPICKDYLKGECRRGMKCKYEHLQEGAVSQSSTEIIDSGMPFSSGGAVKMRKTEFTIEAEMELVPLADYRAVEEENRVLRRDVDELRRTVGVLVAANELLLEQNARFRSSSAPVVSQMIATPAVMASSSTVAALSHIAIDGGSGLVVAQQPATAASVATLRPCVTATATLHPVMTATARLHPIATATLHPVGTATLHPSATATLHSVVTGSIVSASPVAVDPSPGSVAIGMPSHAIVPVTIAVAALQTAPVPSSLTTSASSTYVTYPIMSNGTHTHMG